MDLEDDPKRREESDRQPLVRSPKSQKTEYGSLHSALRDDFKKSTSKAPEKHDNFGKIGLLSYATCLDYWLIGVGMLASIVHGAGFPLLSVVLGGMTNVFLRAQNSDFVVFESGTIGGSGDGGNQSSIWETITRDDFKMEVQRYSIYYLVLGVAMFITSYIQIACWETLAERLVQAVRRHYFRAILRQDIGWYDSMQTGNLTARLTDDLERVREGVGDKCSIFIQLISAFVAGFAVGFIYGWQMTLVMLLFTPALAWTNAWMGRMMVHRTRMEQQQYAIAGAIADETFSSMRTVLALNGQHQELKRYEKALEDGRSLGVKKYLYMSFGLSSNYIVTYMSFAVAFWFASRLVVWYPDYDRGAIFTVFFAVMNGSTALGAALPNLSSMSSAKGALHYVMNVLNTRPNIDAYSTEGFQLNGRVRGAINFNKVNFSYPIRPGLKILNDISFSVKAGQKLALVGSSGCGKSTIVNMILRFYDPDQGTVVLDGYDLRELNVRSLRDAIGVVSQEPILFDGTLEENIMLGNEYATREDVNRCCKMANAYSFIHNLPEGLYTRVGERGVQLSGGQKQRIAIARALIRNPKILLLDEATSALDTESEKIVQEALDKAQEGRTTIIVAHRLATLRNVDEILVFHKGQIVERGTHEDLYQKGGVFYGMVNAQQIEQRKDAKAALNTIFDEKEGSSSDSEPEESMAALDFDASVSSLPREDRVGLLRKRSGSRTGQSVTSRRKRTTASISSIDSQHSQMLHLREMQEDMEDSRLKPSPISKIFNLNRDNWPLALLGLFGCMISGIIVPIFALIYSQIFAVFSEPVEQLEKDAVFWSAMFVVIGFLNALGFFISANMLGRCGEALTKKLRLEAFRNLLRQDIGFYDDERHNTGKLCTRFATDAPNVRYVFTRLPVVISSVVTLFGAILVGFLNGWKLALVLLIIVPLIIASGFFEMKLHFGKQMRNTELLEEAGKVASEAVENIRTVAGLNKQMIFHKKYCDHLLLPFRTNMRQAQIYAVVFAFSQSLMFFMYALAFWVGSIFVLNGSMTPVAVYRVFFAIAFCGQSVGQLSSFIPDVVKARVAASLLFHLIERPTKIESLSDLGISKRIVGGVELRNVHFAYPTRRKARVLTGLNLEIREGQTVALVGYSGCGKSTIISLLERFYNPRRGNIVIDGVSIADYNIQKLREQVCIVSQEPILFDATIAENICYGLAGAEAVRDNDHIGDGGVVALSKSNNSGSQLSAGSGGGGLFDIHLHLGVSYEEIVAAATAANIHNFILGLPDGYQTRVGAKGTQLSGGQKQRIAIARALIRKPTVLLLDEATSALDSESEKVVQEALDNAKKGRTCIVIAHRLSTVQNADQIAVINEGKVVQKGTHQELLQQDGIYQSLCETQILRSVDVSEKSASAE